MYARCLCKLKELCSVLHFLTWGKHIARFEDKEYESILL